MPTNSRRLCDCHSEPMQKHGFQRNGRQRWQCAIKRRTVNARYAASPKGRAKDARAIAKARAAGLCLACRAREAAPGYSACENCRQRDYVWSHTTAKGQSRYARALLKKSRLNKETQ